MQSSKAVFIGFTVVIAYFLLLFPSAYIFALFEGFCYLQSLWCVQSGHKHKVYGNLVEAPVPSNQGEAPN